MSPRLLVVDAERELRSWLLHHIEILWPDSMVEEAEPQQLKTRASTISTRDFDVIVLGAYCGEGDSADESAEGLEILHALQRRTDAPPVVLIATGGNEISAVRAMRLGAADYLPRRLLNAQRLATALRAALRAKPQLPRPWTRSARAARRNIDPAHLHLPQYSILHKLGESTRAAVYLAQSASLGRNVALKISKPTIDNTDACEEFAREYAAISAVDHPSVVSIYDYGFHDGREFIAMEYFPCGDLKTRLQQPITITESLEYARRICDALQVIHRAGLIHRDLKPPNVMLREDGSVVLIDFGIAKRVDSGGGSTVAGVLRGSPYYMSPEQAQGQRLDARSDLYSVGVILFEMLSGSKPYTGNSAVEVLQQHVHGPRPALPPECAHIEALLDRFMARDRDERFPDAKSAYEALLALSTAPNINGGSTRALTARPADEDRDTALDSVAEVNIDRVASVKGSHADMDPSVEVPRLDAAVGMP